MYLYDTFIELLPRNLTVGGEFYMLRTYIQPPPDMGRSRPGRGEYDPWISKDFTYRKPTDNEP